MLLVWGFFVGFFFNLQHLQKNQKDEKINLLRKPGFLWSDFPSKGHRAN